MRFEIYLNKINIAEEKFIWDLIESTNEISYKVIKKKWKHLSTFLKENGLGKHAIIVINHYFKTQFTSLKQIKNMDIKIKEEEKEYFIDRVKGFKPYKQSVGYIIEIIKRYETSDRKMVDDKPSDKNIAIALFWVILINRSILDIIY